MCRFQALFEKGNAPVERVSWRLPGDIFRTEGLKKAAGLTDTSSGLQ